MSPSFRKASALICGVLTSFAAPEIAHADPNCSSHGSMVSCTVLVVVTPEPGGCLASLPAGQKLITFDPKAKRVFITWQLSNSPDYRFSRDGIVVMGDTEQEFIEGRVLSNGQRFRLKNKHTFAKEYDYEVNITKKKSSTKCQVDPKIGNQ